MKGAFLGRLSFYPAGIYSCFVVINQTAIFGPEGGL